MDLRAGCVVRAVRGERAKYQPWRSRLCPDAAPWTLLAALKDLGLEQVYVADLDALTGNDAQMTLIKDLASLAPIWLDAGVRTPHQARAWLDARVARVLIASEALPSWEVLEGIVTACGADRIGFSIDMRAGNLCTGSPHMADSAEHAIDRVVSYRVCHLVVLELTSVGTQAGPPWEILRLCRWIRTRHPQVHIVAGGGVRNKADVNRLVDAGADAVLVATALHTGTLI